MKGVFNTMMEGTILIKCHIIGITNKLFIIDTISSHIDHGGEKADTKEATHVYRPEQGY